MSTSTSRPVAAGAPQVDPRGLRAAAGITAAVLVLVLLTASASTPIAVGLLAVQAAVFAIGAFLGVRHSPYGLFFARAIRPRLAPPAELEDARPPQFAQLVGLAFAVVGLLGFALGSSVVALVAVGFALVAALLNAVVGFCLGCEMYLLVRRLAPSAA
ncbi:hypothetical protein HMPREF0063_11471 [Aeromicrobium marinum DSM 15272]|uniref:DUF4395 domain-containing protein n=1 Tax=Aeromicrobium marinum DSM 15272 TaxID=585531 RepID=E2SBR2_9ACTN|nr:DUF4395 domain-containing protein [Aeromicrobium marinum]EFQ83198.1 hypothetical protein HMPREF0063_11471 [Aeromicrobium marinum DSM 15272]